MSTTPIVRGATRATPSHTRRFTRVDAATGTSTTVLAAELNEVCHAADALVAQAKTLWGTSG